MDKEFIDFLKSKISIIDVISSKIRLRKSGKDWFGLCPFHKEKTGSLKVDSEKGYYYCFGCGAHGDIISFIRDFNRVNFLESVAWLASSYGIPMPQKEHTFIDLNKPVYDAICEMKNWFIVQLNRKIGEKAREYLEFRRISRESVEKFQLGFAPDNQDLVTHLKNKGFQNDILLKTGVYNRSKYKNELVPRYSNRLIFPILNSIGKCVGFGGRTIDTSNVNAAKNTAKYINSPETEVFIKSDHLYGYFLAKHGNSREIILTEGYLDVISMHQAGFDGAVASLGTSISKIQINMCWNVCDTPTVLLDGDNAGIKASYRWVDKILPLVRAGKSFKFAMLPQGFDPDLAISTNKPNIIQDAVKNATPLSDWIWDGGFALNPSEIPEQKAAVIKMITDKVETIQDLSVKKLYIQTIRQREKELYYKKSKVFINKENIKPVVSAQYRVEKILIVTIINHPNIMDKIIEPLVKLEFKDHQMQKYKKYILDIYGNCIYNGNEEYITAMSELRNSIATDIVRNAVLHARFAEEDAKDDDAIEGCIKLIERYYSHPLIIEDLQYVSSSLECTFSENEWLRLKELKQEVVLGYVKQQEM